MASQRQEDRPPRPPQLPEPKGPAQDSPAGRDGEERELGSYDDEIDPIIRRNGQRETDRGRWGVQGAVARPFVGWGTYDDEIGR